MIARTDAVLPQHEVQAATLLEPQPPRLRRRAVYRRFVRRTLKILVVLAILYLAIIVLFANTRRVVPIHRQTPFPPTHPADLKIHDPSILKVGDRYYSYSVGPRIVIHEAPTLSGPWKQTGHVLDADSIIPKGDRKAPWAPTTIEVAGTYYCYYAVSQSGCRNSAIGVATSQSPGPGGWTDHGAIINSGTGPGADSVPFDRSNAIDASVIVTSDGEGYLNFGSYWTGIWQVPLNRDLVSARDVKTTAVRHLAYEPHAISPAGKNPNPLCRDPSGSHPIEGAFVSYHAPYYYLWFSWGKCCKYNPKALPAPGKEYQIRVGRSTHPQGPFVDRQGVELTEGGGEVIYGSNGEVYAPGGQGVLTDEGTDILYYHYLNTSVSLDFWEARLGYNPLAYVDGWPVAQ
ncbi:glycosyl hydrolase [Aspergillus ambiguus]|uniref:arabinan endo-1,5-alpha-L-arabinosidase n=1 Tax=Aspergillus ambiguus TaxID=176160 RepID=UPI003CCCA12F